MLRVHTAGLAAMPRSQSNSVHASIHRKACTKCGKTSAPACNLMCMNDRPIGRCHMDVGEVSRGCSTPKLGSDCAPSPSSRSHTRGLSLLRNPCLLSRRLVRPGPPELGLVRKEPLNHDLPNEWL